MDYFKLAEEELKKVTYSYDYPEVDMVRVGKAEVYAKLAHTQAIENACKCQTETR